MIKVDIFSGFLGAGKTTLIKKLIEEAYKGENVVLIENEFGEIGIDAGFLQDAGIKINEMNSGCICCSLVGDFGKALEKVVNEFHPDRILIEPSGVGKLSDIISAVENLQLEEISLNGFTTIVDANKAKIYMKNFGEFYNDQVEHASSIILSHTGGMEEEKIAKVLELLRQHNENATIITTDWAELDGKQILAAMENRDTIEEAIRELEEEHAAHHHHEHHHHHHDDDDDECCCGHHEHHHHHHDDDDDECCCGHHEHHHHHDDDDDECSCGHHHEHGHHHADEVFTSIGIETAKKYTQAHIEEILNTLEEHQEFGFVLRAKGIVEGQDGQWIHFDYVPGEIDVRAGSSGVTGRICVIGSQINEENIRNAFLA